jgi:hypothetical protein
MRKCRLAGLVVTLLSMGDMARATGPLAAGVVARPDRSCDIQLLSGAPPASSNMELGLGVIAASFDAPQSSPTQPIVRQVPAAQRALVPEELTVESASSSSAAPNADSNVQSTSQQPMTAPLLGDTFDPRFLEPRSCPSKLDFAQAGCRECPHYLRFEYLEWWLTGDRVPALVTTSPAGTPQAQAGVLGQPGTTVLFGDQTTLNQGRPGGRVLYGAWLNPAARLELEWFDLGGQNTSFSQFSTGNPILATPFFNLTSAAQAAYLFAYPGLSEGGISFREISYFNGAGVHITRDWSCTRTPNGLHRFSGLWGFRYLGLYERLTIDSITSSPATSTTFDAFRTTNSFFGANLGLSDERYSGRWSLVTIGRLGLGATTQHANISGNSTSLSPANPTGLFALPSNIGSYHLNVFSTVPQLEMKLGYTISPRWRLTAGYDLIYWNRVARPGQQIDTSLNTTQLSGTRVGTSGPVFNFRESTLLIQGVSGGLEFRY